MTRPLLTLLAAAALGAAAPAAPQRVPIDVRALDTYFNDEPRVEVNLKGSLLRLLVEASREDEPEFAEMVSGLTGVTVRVYDLDTAVDGLTTRLSRFGDDLEDQGWSTLVRVRGEAGTDDEDDVWIYVLDDGDVFGGLAVMSLDHTDEQVAFVLIDGVIDPSQIGRLSSRFGGPDLDDIDDLTDQ